MLTKEILWFGRKCILACDGKCYKAWGINSRPSKNGKFKKDDELGIAPENPGTFEGGQGKNPKSLNKWCARECERSDIFEEGEKIVLRNL